MHIEKMEFDFYISYYGFVPFEFWTSKFNVRKSDREEIFAAETMLSFFTLTIFRYCVRIGFSYSDLSFVDSGASKTTVMFVQNEN